MKKLALLLFLLASLAGPALAQDEDRSTIHSASEMDKPAIYGYLINEFFHQKYQEGPAPVWDAAALVLALDLLLLLDLWRRRGWLR